MIYLMDSSRDRRNNAEKGIYVILPAADDDFQAWQSDKKTGPSEAGSRIKNAD